jgi:hypothetical protein
MEQSPESCLEWEYWGIYHRQTERDRFLGVGGESIF